ncbi:hypothetical protein BDF21DRAFT_448096 [Thamnidium elegans]|nr:hypothetical protein BDF21DRAFT_448096 [Thamnidium elegans]
MSPKPSSHIQMKIKVVIVVAIPLSHWLENKKGPNAVDEYSPQPTDWANATKSDVLYASDNTNSFPPILIEVQYNVDDNFLHRLVQYCEEANKQYSTEPVVLVFVINKIRDSVMSKTTKDRKQKFLLKLPSYPWAKKCLFLNDYSIHDHLNTISLHPLVALGAFLTAQKVSILDHDQRDGSIIQQLYGISKHVFEHVATREKTTVDCDIDRVNIKKKKK